MANNFIKETANKDIEATNYAIQTLKDALPSDPVDASETGLLIGAAAAQYAEVIKFVPHGNKIAIAITLFGGGVVNTTINVAKGDESGKALAKGIAGAIASAIVLAGLTVAAPAAIAVGTTVLASYVVGELVESVVGDIYDWIITPDTQVENDKLEQHKTIETTKTLEQSMQEFNTIITAQNQNWDIRATIPSVTNPESYAEQLAYNADIKEATVKTSNSTTLNEGTILLLKKDINQITINNHTADVVTPTNLQLRNALTSIDDYQFLLSNILIKVGEKLDMGVAGIITVSSGDTLSQLAVQYLEQALEEFLEVA